MQKLAIILTSSAIAMGLIMTSTMSYAANRQKLIRLAPKQIQWHRLGPNEKIAYLQGNPKKRGPFAIRVESSGRFYRGPHYHPNAVTVTMIKGTMYREIGPIADRKKAKKLPRGSFSVIPGGVPHSEWANGHIIVQIQGMGPWTTHSPKAKPR